MTALRRASASSDETATTMSFGDDRRTSPIFFHERGPPHPDKKKTNHRDTETQRRKFQVQHSKCRMRNGVRAVVVFVKFSVSLCLCGCISSRGAAKSRIAGGEGGADVALGLDQFNVFDFL